MVAYLGLQETDNFPFHLNLWFLFFQFLKVLNSKKAKLRDLRDQLTEQGTAVGKLPQEEEDESTDKTESFYDRSDDEKSEEETSKNIT